MLEAREAMGSTGIGDGIAIPHARYPVVLHLDKPLVSLCFLEQPIDFGALDARPVQALRCLLRDGGKHPSPNSGLTEAAVAGAGTLAQATTIASAVTTRMPPAKTPMLRHGHRFETAGSRRSCCATSASSTRRWGMPTTHAPATRRRSPWRASSATAISVSRSGRT